MNLDRIKHIYFLGIGGIGMSALARYFLHKGCEVFGYDRTQTVLTEKLSHEGARIHFTPEIDRIPDIFIEDQNSSLVIYTPAIPGDMEEFLYFKEKNCQLYKRSEILGLITENSKTLAIAGTHGKTTVTTMSAHLLNHSKLKCNAFLGGIAINYNSNLILDAESEYTVVEADEYDRSFLQLNPSFALITATDIDHLDIYENPEKALESFSLFAQKIKPGGKLLAHKNAKLSAHELNNVDFFTYSIDDNKSDFYATDLKLNKGRYSFNLQTPKARLNGIECGMPGMINAENAVAACSMAVLLGIEEDEIKTAIRSFKGIHRRFEMHEVGHKILIDDYAHHPEEIKACLNSAKSMFPGRKIIAIFQPHLYSRTRDFYLQFAASLDLADEVYLTDIYPAREKPIPGIDSGIIFSSMRNKNKTLCPKKEILTRLKTAPGDVIIIMGAGDINDILEPLKKMLIKNV